jgi:hypothetical protein
VARKWVEAYALAPGFPAIFNDPEVVKSLEQWMPDKSLLQTILGLHDAVPFPPFWRASWYIEWRNTAENELPQILLGQKKDVDVIKTLRDSAVELKARYA